jgi:hypothetical protein
VGCEVLLNLDDVKLVVTRDVGCEVLLNLDDVKLVVTRDVGCEVLLNLDDVKQRFEDDVHVFWPHCFYFVDYKSADHDFRKKRKNDFKLPSPKLLFCKMI